MTTVDDRVVALSTDDHHAVHCFGYSYLAFAVFR
jgi:hypothetical protein